MHRVSGFRSITSRLIFWVAGATGLLFATASVYSFFVSRRIVLEDASEIALQNAEANANQIEQVLRSVEEGTRLLASILGETTVSRTELERMLRTFVEGDSRIYGSAAAVAPDRGAAYAPYFHREGTELIRTDLSDESYRYWEKDWYKTAARSGEPHWSEPYFDEGGGNVLMVTYAVPVWRSEHRDRKLLGVVTADISVEWLREFVASSHFEGSGYGVVLSRKGRVLAHPDPRVIVARSALDLVRPDADPRAKEIVQKMLEGEKGFVAYDDRYLGRRARVAFRPVEGAGWSFAVIYPEDELLEDVHGLAKVQLSILAAGLVVLVVLISILSHRLTRPLRELSASAGQIATGDLESSLPAIRSADEVGALTDAFHNMRDSLKTYIENLEVTTKAKERLESELQIARRIQMDMLPPSSAGGEPGDGYELAASLVPARHVGGDLYDYFVHDSKLSFVVGDVSGKGVAAALFMARAKTLFQTIAAREPDLAEVIRTVNVGLCQDNEQGMFVTAFAGTLDTRTGELTYVGAGHDAPVVVPGNGGRPTLLPLEGGPVLGLLENADYPSQRSVLAKGDTVVAYTDGVGEALDEKGDFFTIERLVETLARSPDGSAAAVTRTVLGAVKAFAGNAPQSDDITVMAARYVGRS